jgi:hypothetical protein
MALDVSDVDVFTSRFNACSSPKEAVALISHLPVEAVARALYNGTNVDPTLLGACLGHHHAYCQSLANEYPLSFTSFRGMDVVPALRSYLWRFRLPGESAQIERILTGFATSFFKHNQTEGAPSAGSADRAAIGFYIAQPPGPTCCIHCGVLDGQHGQTLKACQGCNLVYFCRRCRILACHRGHAAAGNIGFGRGCQAALGLEVTGGTITFTDGSGRRTAQAVGASRWVTIKPARCPAKSVDALMVLCYAIIMLTTNLHNPKVKTKMKLHEFLQQNVSVNDGGNYPGDYLAAIYADIEGEELKVQPA